jgi:amino acid transporter
MVAATFFMVSGGTYGTEDIVRGAGYGGAMLVLLLTPVLWSLPTALMIGELGSALPKEGGYYAWVRRAFGNFLGFQEAWLSLAASIFDMAIYPTLFVLYLARLLPWFGAGKRGVLVGAVVVTVCALLNIAGVRVVGSTSMWLFLLLSTPFVAIVVLALFHHRALAETVAPPAAGIGVVGGILVAMWNYMGWDNASTIAEEVEHPQRTYPRVMLVALAIITLSYILPVVAVWWTHLPDGSFGPGAWADIAGLLGGRWLSVFTVAAAMMSAFGMFNALVLSYSRVPLAMAECGMLPRVFARVHPRTRAPWVSITALATAWALCLGLGFERLVTLDIMLYGASLALEFAALVALRITAQSLPRPFRVPGGLAGAVALGVCPMALLGFSLVHSGREHILGMNALLFGTLIVGSGFVVYLFTGREKVSEVSEVPEVTQAS